MTKRIAIIGAGAVGGYLGAWLTRAGQDVVLVDGWSDHVRAMREDGLWIDEHDPAESFCQRVTAMDISDVQSLRRGRPVDIALICVKSYDTAWATALILPFLAPDGYVVSVQNSINEPEMAAIAGHRRTLGCSVSLYAGELVAPGRVLRTFPRQPGRVGLHLGELHGVQTPRLDELVALFNLVEPSAATTNIWGKRWSKLVINSMRNGVSALTGMSGKERDLDPEIRRLIIRLGGQAVRVGRAQGYALEPVSSGIEMELLALAEEGCRDALARLEAQIIDVANLRGDKQRPSMGQDMRKGRMTETGHINGLIARLGTASGVDAGLHGMVHRAIRRVDDGLDQPSPELARGLM